MNLADLAVAEYKCCQDPWELSVLLDVVAHNVRPRLILEIGSWFGGSLFAWRSLNVDVLAVTLPETMPQLDGHTYGAEMLWGNSHDDEMRERIPAALHGRQIGFAWIDGDHSSEGAQADFELCRWLGVPVIGMHDVVGDAGVRLVWEQASRKYPYMLIHRAPPSGPPGCAPGTGLLWTG